jgi:quercetin dioxygenase-like cupin family protein
MPRKATLLTEYGVDGVIYDYEVAGELLEDHIHDELHNHITIIARGSFRVTGHASLAGEIYKVGDVIDWPPNVTHGFIALEDNSRMVQITKRIKS